MRKAFTIVEMIIIMLIISALTILASITARGVMERSNTVRIVATLKILKTALYNYFTDTGDFPKAGSDWYDPGNGDDYGFKYLMEDDDSGQWRGPYINEIPRGPGDIRYRYWKSYVSGDVRDSSGNWIHIENMKCAVITISGFQDEAYRDYVDEKIRKIGIGLSWIGYSDTDQYYISVVVWMGR